MNDPITFVLELFWVIGWNGFPKKNTDTRVPLLQEVAVSIVFLNL